MKLPFLFILLLISFSLSAQLLTNNPMPSSDYPSFTSDGAWCWFSDPRAVFFKGKKERTYVGWVDSKGNIIVASYVYSPLNSIMETDTLAHLFDKDDHANPSILIDKNGHIMVFYAKHYEQEGIRMRRSKRPEDITEWEDERIVGKNNPEMIAQFGDRYTYANVAYLSDEDKIYLFWRSSDGKPTYSVSPDGGVSWSIGQVFIMPDTIYRFRRPYVKVVSNGKDQIAFAFTDGHPRKETTNNIYFMYLKNSAFYKANGSLIKPLKEIPVKPKEADLVYEADLKLGKSWIWDIAFDDKGRPRLAYVRFPDDENHIYRYARWNGRKWKNYDIVNSGKWFPETPEGKKEPEPNYSGGLSIDQENPNVIYLSVARNGIFEIEQWTAKRGGRKWKTLQITTNSTKNNIRPVAVRNAQTDNPFQLLWMRNEFYQHYEVYKTSIQMPFILRTVRLF